MKPAVGRSFSAEEDKRSARQVVLISWELWQRHFGGNAGVIGGSVVLNATPSIIGVLPAGFSFPASGIDVWVTRPSDMAAIAPQFWDRITVLIGLGRLKPGISIRQAEAELAVLNRRYVAEHPDLADGRKGVILQATNLHDYLVAKERSILWTLFAAVGFVLLIACANVASLLLARASSRTQEFAVRAALGAGRSRLVRQLLTESLFLSIAGGILGILAARVALQSLTRLSALDLARANPIRLDGWVMLFIIVVSATSGLLFGLFPAWQISRPDLVSVLRERSQSDNSPSMRSGNAFGFNTRGLLVVMQVELSVILLIGSTLLLRSIERLHAVNPGLRTSNLLTMHLDLPPLRYNTAAKKEAFFRELIETIDATPGVWSAAAVLTLPTGPKYETNVQIAQQQQVSIVDRPGVQLQIVTPGYFRTAGIAIERGSEFAERDDSGNGLVAIVNESFARRFWADFPNGVDPIGQDVLSGNNTQNGFQIVGVVADVHEQGLVGDLPWQAGYR